VYTHLYLVACSAGIRACVHSHAKRHAVKKTGIDVRQLTLKQPRVLGAFRLPSYNITTSLRSTVSTNHNSTRPSWRRNMHTKKLWHLLKISVLLCLRAETFMLTFSA